VATLPILDPTAPSPEVVVGPVSGPGSLVGRSVALLDNGWSSLETIYARFEELLRERHGVARITREKIPIGRAAPHERMRALAAEADVAIVGLAN
jgi:hypothetical protein